MSTSVLLADDHPFVREGVRRVLCAETEFVVVAEAGDGLEALRLTERLRPNVVVLDLMLPGLSGLEVLAILRKRLPETRIVVLSMQSDTIFVSECLKNGASGYVLKSTPTAFLIHAIREGVAGRAYVSPPLSMEDSVLHSAHARGPSMDPHQKLTPRERQVLQLAAEGLTNPEVAARLHISARTAEHHRAAVMRKLGLHGQSDLVRYAIRRGILGPDA